ncbi:MAG TPA: carboxypeptidase-like regulatory domain-containing protein [Candidatus Hydrogenedentes bacterium]|jgi:hypothetical protein|nr:carboxypeptidase-like regulatory domain-containing protein [Candidatus Hydrogenedentota bacterium]
MNLLVLFFSVAAATMDGSTLSGTVLTQEGSPVPRARVFIEQGLDGAIREARAAEDGAYSFAHVEAGTVGVFAIADGFAFGGLSITVPVDEQLTGLTIRLRPPSTLSGKVVNEKGDAVAGARIVRIGLMNEPRSDHPGANTKLGIPYAKLEPMGFAPIVSDSKGRFTVPSVPRESLLALKVTGHGYAQQGVSDLRAGDSKVEIVLQPGVLIQGRVLTRAAKEPFSGALITLRNAQPPHDTTATRSDGAGEFRVRLQPGLYLYRASGGDYRSVGWEELLVTGQQSTQSVVVYAVGFCEIRGKVANAITGDPIPGARVVLRTFDNPDSSVRTNTQGQYFLKGVEGENTVILESAPGFVLPERNARPVGASEGERIELPAFWVVPTPEVQLAIVDQDLNPLSRCVVTLLQPPQFGWQPADDTGHAPLRMGQIASEGVVMGLAEQAGSNRGALFAFDARETREPVVQLLPLSTVAGQVKEASGGPAVGAMISLVLADDHMETPIWSTASSPDGRFEIPGVVPHVQLQCLVHTAQQPVKSDPFVVEPSSRKDLGELIARVSAGKSLRGQSLKWQDYPRIAGPEIPDSGPQTLVLSFGQHERAEMLIEGWQRAATLFSGPQTVFAVVLDAPPEQTAGPAIPVLRGTAPASATTYVVSGDGVVLFETFGIPPVSVIQHFQGVTQ